MSSISIRKAISELSTETENPAGEKYISLSVKGTEKLSAVFNMERCEVEITALEMNIIPERYHRNIGTIGLDGQIKLLKSKAGVIGAGGLGGFVLEMLARAGVGKMVVVDNDYFCDSNLNRQLFSTENNLAESKVDAAVRRVKDINKAVEIEGFQICGTRQTLPPILSGCNIVIDCLDNLQSRFELEEVCSRLNIILVHGAIAGFLGQLAVIRPGKPLLQSIYGCEKDGDIKRGVEVQLGNPVITPAMLAAWQTGEALKILAGLDGILPENRLLIMDMQAGNFYQVDISP
ncbi:MAG: HesA/MoeB/ThiF family protein [Bacillota bacterium]|nr:HesA/MoeB/ThiF family protein [Bacillota bacterium]